MLLTLERELNHPHTVWGKRYMIVLMGTIVGSILFLFVEKEYPVAFPLGSLQLLLVESAIVIVFGVDFVLRVSVIRRRDRESLMFLAIDGLAIVPSLAIVLYYLGVVESSELSVLALLRLFRLFRVIRLLRVSNVLIDVFGSSIFTLVFGTMAAHLSLRVFLLESSLFFGFDMFAGLDQDVLMIAVAAVGSIFGIALAITFGIVNRKQIEITELHRVTLDSLAAFERDLKILQLGDQTIDFNLWRQRLDWFLNMKIPYLEMKQHTNVLLVEIRQAIKDRPSLDVPFHNGLVQNMSAFLTKTQIEFHPSFYTWLNLIANLYFILIMVAAQGMTGVIVQMLVIYVFKGLVIVIDDMDHAVDDEVTIFNSKILPI